MSKKNELVKLLSRKKSRTWYAYKLGVSVEEVNRMMDEIRKGDKGNDEGEKEGVVLEKVEENGDRKVEYISNKPLTKEEIEKLYGIDGITSRLSTYWNKQTPSGKYLVSALIKCTVIDFYSQEELAKKLKEIFPEIKEVKIKVPYIIDKGTALFIYLSDDHCGSETTGSIYGKQYSEEIYTNRLLKILEELEAIGYTYEKVFVVNMGDEVDGWNKQTTRGGHELDGALSNREQFDMYTRARKKFYDALFASGRGASYEIITLENSNHSGNDLSYIVNQYLQCYIEARYKEVSFIGFDKFIDVLNWGNHVIALTHGKDEKLMKSPLPLELNSKTDLWLFEFFDKLGYSPNEYYTHTIKGDIHKYNSNTGKSGRYVNCPSIAGGSNWIELNFGDTRAGALIEILRENSPNVISMPIWFN